MQNRKLLCSWCENEVVTTNTATMLALKHCLIVATELVAMSIFVTTQVAAKLFFCIVYNISTYHIKNKLSKRFLFFIRLSLLIIFQFKKNSRCGMLTYPLLGAVGSVSSTSTRAAHSLLFLSSFETVQTGGNWPFQLLSSH